MSLSLPIKGRGSAENPANRFEKIDVAPDPDADCPVETSAPQTVYLKDSSRSILARNDSPDVGFEWSINPYRGCSHGCVYCYARPTHEYLGFSAGLDFETRIVVKLDAPALLRAELSAPKWKPAALSMSGVTDCYQPIERKLQITRQCLAVLEEFRNPVGIVTKNHLATRDIDILKDIASWNGCVVMVSITTLDADLTRVMEPRTSTPRRRLEAIEKLSRAGVPVGVMVAPIIPGLTDHETPGILKAAAEAGARCAGYTALRLPYAVKDLFANWLERHFPQRKQKVLNRIRSMRGGKLNDSNFGSRMKGEGLFAEQIKSMFKLAKKRAGLDREFPELCTSEFRIPGEKQMTLWG